MDRTEEVCVTPTPSMNMFTSSKGLARARAWSCLCLFVSFVKQLPRSTRPRAKARADGRSSTLQQGWT
ncbi:hypothetical protein SKAU_G00386040 [Synaphobranchus kaupii]|uniref:Uncharacterized protein n=1 Tax=Synaphobranchus kaupii TaxID=118154 RepID=A0A9Q1EEL7_SYNKA|nr:hypothetical protein SKAU_G00386040 [Synaphobranchus kaupii]